MTSSGAPSYFVDHKRGEVNELKALLRNQRVERDAVKKREVIKKVIAYMTLGIDVSKIFSEMVMAASTKDLVQKKMVYHYLCTYAHQKANLALMAINTLQKDCQDEDPMVRGLALRSLTSLRLPNIVEYSMLCMRKGLNDPSPYVRKTAVAGVAKIYRLFPQQIKESDLVDLLYNMIKDKDTSVVQNALCALNEILASEGKMAINQAIILYILNRLREFNEWGQCYVLELVARYTPANQNEMFDIMNLLEDRLKHSNSAVVLATTKVFLHFTQSNSKIHQEVIKRLKAPLLTLMGGGSVELAYVVLSHIRLLVARAPGVFDSEYKEFFCRFNDPVPVKTEKLSILTLLANDKNFSDVINELSEYVTDTDAPIARASIKGIARIAIKIETAADESIEHLLSFLDLNLDYTTAETCVMLKDLLRKYPERYEDVLPALQKCLKRGGIEEADGKAAVVWMIGEYGHDISDAPYILEPLIDAFAEEPSPAVRHELLTSAMKLFFKRPPEMKKMLGKLLNAAIADVGKVDVRDRALMYYRLLRLDVHEAARVVNCPKVIVDAFAESEDKDLKEKIFAEFNTLSVVYGLPSERFVDEKKNKDPGITLGEDYDKPYEEDKDDGTNGTKSDKKKEAEDEDDKEGITSANPAASVPTTPVVPKMAEKKHETPKKEVDLLSMGDLLDFGGHASTPASPGPASLSLKPAAKIDPKTFQQKWMGKAKEDGFAEVTLRMPQLASAAGGTGAVLAKYVSTLCEGKQLATMAQGVQGNVMKLYLYATDDTGLYLLEFVLDLNSGKGRASIKCDNPSPAAPGLIGAVLRDALKSFL